MNVNEFYKKYKGKRITSIGGVSNQLQWNSPYGGQCASAARQWLVQGYGYPDVPYGNGKDFVNIPNAETVSKPQNGDIIVFPNLTEWGHVAIYRNGKMIDQNPDPLKDRNIYKGKKIYIRPQSQKINQGGIKVLKANQLLASHGRIVLPANRALYDNIPTKKTPFTKVIQKGQYFYNGFYTIEKYKGVDSQGRKCNFVQIRDLNNNKLLGYAPVYSSDEIYRTKLELIKLP